MITVPCPACGGPNPPEAVFCEHCHKALGEMPFVTELMQSEARWHERIADRTTAFIGKPHFLAVHAVWMGLWIAGNTGMATLLGRWGGFDLYPYNLLGLLLGVEAVFITGVLLISQNRQSAFADKRAELDYAVNVQTFRRLENIEAVQKRILAVLEHQKETYERDAG